MAERRLLGAQVERAHNAVVRDAAEAEQGAQPRHGRDFRDEKRRQVVISWGVGLFCGGTQRTAFEILQRSSCSRPRACAVAARREAEAEQSGVKQVAGIIAREGTAGEIGAAQARREADDEERRASGPKLGTGAL